MSGRSSAPPLTAQAIAASLLAGRPLAGRKILIIVENLPVPFDRRVWQEATTLASAGAQVSVICPTGRGYDQRRETIDGIEIYRHPLPAEANGPLGYLREYSAALFHQIMLSWKIRSQHGIDVIHACNPPDLIFLVALTLRMFGISFLFDHHDINPELYEAKFGRRDVFWRLMIILERMTFQCADVVISTNESYRRIAIERGGKAPEDVFVVRSGPNLDRLQRSPPDESLKNKRAHLVGYVGVMGEQEGIDILLETVRHIVFDLKRTDIQFCLVGSGPSFSSLQKLARDLDVDSYVSFLGRVPDEVLFSALSTADICVNPDRANAMNDKSTMNKILEYMAFGRAIVQFDLTEGRVSAGEASLYAKNNDVRDFAGKILHLIDNPSERDARGALGLERVHSQFSWHHETPHLINAYQHLFEKRRSFARA